MPSGSEREKLIVFMLFILLFLVIMNVGQHATFNFSYKYLTLYPEHDNTS